MFPALDVCRRNPNMAVPFILMASYLYYIKNDSSPLSDYDFDRLCDLARNRWASIEHRHKHLITEDDLEAGTLFYLRDSDYPPIVKNAAMLWASGYRPGIAYLLSRITEALDTITTYCYS